MENITKTNKIDHVDQQKITYTCKKFNLCSLCLIDFINKNDEYIDLYHDKYERLYKVNESVILSHGARMTRDNKLLAKQNTIKELKPQFDRLYHMNHTVSIQKCRELHQTTPYINSNITETNDTCNCFLDESFVFKKLCLIDNNLI
jgi:hypothetical protein